MEKLTFVKDNSGLSEKSIKHTLELLDEGATVPFIARYRKEKTSGLDEVQIAQIRDLSKKFEDVISRQQAILKAIDDQGKLTDNLKANILNTLELTSLEDIYLPFKQKRETRGDKAKKNGLEPLAKMIMAQRGGNPFQMASSFLKGNIFEEEEALQGAKDIIAEWVNENAALRAKIRSLFQRYGVLHTKVIKGKEQEGEKYKDYFDFSEPLYKCASHRFLAIHRAEREKILKVKLQPDEEKAMELIERFVVKSNDDCGEVVLDAAHDGYKRLIAPSIENDVLNEAKEKADTDAIKIFSQNLQQLLLASPLGSKRILAIDPGFRTGCKVVCMDELGSLLTNTTIFPHPPQNEKTQAQAKINQLIEAYKIDAIAIGDGTAGRETEHLIKHIRFSRDIEVYVVREDGASIYSASSVARKEFPDYDVTVRGAVSIGRRLMDPLAELVKIDPKSVGVGQYQHEVDQNQLKSALDDVVVSCVNKVGVDINTASPYLLAYVSGLGPTLAENIVQYRMENGYFNNRNEIRKVKRLGDKAYEQAAGFLRIRGGENPLDNSSVHPESYRLVTNMAKGIGAEIKELIGNETLITKLKHSDFPDIDSFTFNDIVSELKKPGRDPRKMAKVLEFDGSIKTMEDLRIGMELNGIVNNVTAFGAFINIGIKENGLIHKSNLADTHVTDPTQHISLHEHVKVQVIEIDSARKRIGLKRLS